MKTSSSLNQFGAACTAALCLLALAARAASPAAAPAAPPTFRPPTFVAPTLIRPDAPKKSPDSKAAKKGSKPETATAVLPPPPLVLTPGVPVAFQVIETPPGRGFSSQHPGGAQRNRSVPQNGGVANVSILDPATDNGVSAQKNGGNGGLPSENTARSAAPTKAAPKKSRMSANEASASGALKTIARPAPPTDEADDEPPGTTTNTSRSNIKKPDRPDVIAPTPPNSGDDVLPGASINISRDNIVGGGGNGKTKALPIGLEGDPPSMRMVAQGIDGKALRYAKVVIQDATGKTIATVKTDRKGCVSWAPPKAGSYKGIVTLVR